MIGFTKVLKHIFSIVIPVSLLLVPVTGFTQVYLDSTASVPERVTDLVSRMTLDEKIGQMVQTERNFENINSVIKNSFLGSILSGGGSVPGNNSVESWISMYNGMQNSAFTTRLKIPIIYGIDAVHGNNNVKGATIFPHNIGLGCTWDTLLVKQCARATAVEVRATGLNWTFSPCIAVPRNIKWGRTYEGFGETPELQMMMARAAVLGYQGDSVGDPHGILACAKHFIADGGTLNGTNAGNSAISEAELRAIHLPGYIEAIHAGVGSVMISFNSWNGQLCHGHQYLITELLKGELGFEGFTVSDWEGVKYLSDDFKTAVKMAVNAGIDMFMEPYRPLEFITNLRELVNAGEVPVSRIDDAVKRILTVKFRMRLFERRYATTALKDSLGCDAHRAVAREAVRKSAVLLKNENHLLPLSKTTGKILVAGPKSHDIGSQCGGWTISWQGSTGTITSGTTILEAVKSVRGAANVVYSINGATTEPVDYAIVVVGETPYAEGQGDSQNPQLTTAEINLINKVEELNIPYVVLLLSGRPMMVSQIIADADAFVACWLPGTEASGITDVLFGSYGFTGKLSHSWPTGISQEPINYGQSPYYPLFEYGFGLTTQPSTIHSNVKTSLIVSPNPAVDQIKVKNTTRGTLKIHDLTGLLVHQTEAEGQEFTIDISPLQPGVYLISQNTSRGLVMTKMVKI